jgi:uncharacterized protein
MTILVSRTDRESARRASPGRALLLAAIRGYKRHVSPYKGFGCACRVHLGAPSCSTLGLRAISRYGAWRGLGVLRLRLGQCRLVAREYRARPFMARPAEAGFVDCIACDAGCLDLGDACSFGDAACEVVGCAGDADDCASWWGSRRTADVPLRRRRRRGDPVSGQPPSPVAPAEPPADA